MSRDLAERPFESRSDAKLSISIPDPIAFPEPTIIVRVKRLFNFAPETFIDWLRFWTFHLRIFLAILSTFYH
jgi:hypothetical protein